MNQNISLCNKKCLCQWELRIVFGARSQDIHLTLMNKDELFLDLSHKVYKSIITQPNENKQELSNSPE